MRKYTNAERLFLSELIPIAERVRQKRRERTKNKPLYDYRERNRIAKKTNNTASYVVLIRNLGMSVQDIDRALGIRR